MAQGRIGAAVMLGGLLCIPAAVDAQVAPAPGQTPGRGGQAVEAIQPSAPETSRQLRELFRKYPPSLPQIFRLDPTLLGNDAYLAPYRDLREFLRAHPEIVRSPEYYFSFAVIAPAPTVPTADQVAWEYIWRMMDPIGFAAFLVGLIATLGWLVRQLLSHQRWVRAAKIQTDLHAKLLERVQSAEDIKTYLQSAGLTRFITDAPAQLPDAKPGTLFGRVISTLQAGTVLVSAGVGAIVAGRQHFLARADDLLVVGGMLILALGCGFVLAAGAAFIVSQRLGVLAPPPSARPDDGSPV